MKQSIQMISGFAFLGVLLYIFIWIVKTSWNVFITINPNLAVGLLTAVTTILVGTLTVVLGRYFERKKELETHFRDKKIEIYDEFLKEFFKMFNNSSNNQQNETNDIVAFLQEWQRKMVLWGGANVLVAYFKWMSNLKSGANNVKNMLLMDEFFRAMRKDIGQSNSGLEKGAFVHVILKNPHIFLSMIKKNPNVSFEEIVAAENALNKK